MFRESLASPWTLLLLLRLEARPEPSSVDEVGRRRSRSDAPGRRNCELFDDISVWLDNGLLVLSEVGQGERGTARPTSGQ